MVMRQEQWQAQRGPDGGFTVDQPPCAGIEVSWNPDESLFYLKVAKDPESDDVIFEVARSPWAVRTLAEAWMREHASGGR